MNKQEIRDILNAHKEHYRVLPTLAMLELNGLITSLEVDIEAEKPLPILDIKKAKKKAKKKK